MPLPIHLSIPGPSTLALPTLAPIPGSALPTPNPTPSPGPNPDLPGPQPQPPPSHKHGESSRRFSLTSSSFPSGSYFPANTRVSSERPRPAPLEIPLGTPDEPLFSAYPNTTQTANRNFTFPLGPVIQLKSPKRRIQSDTEPELEGDSEGLSSNEERQPRVSSRPPPRPPKSRRRASTFSHSTPPGPPTPDPAARRGSLHHPLHAAPASPRSFRPVRRPRASSLAAVNPPEAEFTPGTMPHWPTMLDEESRRLDLSPKIPDRVLPSSTSLLQSAFDESVTTLGATSPTFTARGSSLVNNGILLSISNLSLSRVADEVKIVSPDDEVMPHEPPPRRSSLDYGSRVLLDLEPKVYDSKTARTSIDDEVPEIRSILSASLTGTDTTHSTSLEYYSTSSSKEHPLSSASTSLSRSVKSSKQPRSDLTRRLEKRRMILLELVETEIAYIEDLKVLVLIYLPQLYAMMGVSERTADMVGRNAAGLLLFHEGLGERMVGVLKEEEIGYEAGEGGEGEDGGERWKGGEGGKLERAARKLAGLFVDEVSGFSAYNDYCAGSIAAATLVRHVALRSDYEAFERRCQLISASQPQITLRSLLSESPSETSTLPSNRSRLHFRDFLITPIQRVCRYPLLLAQLLSSAATPSPMEERRPPSFTSASSDQYDVGVDIERALGAMRGVAEEADEARRIKEAEIKSATILERMELHPALSTAFLKSLGTCRLIGSLDVLHQHPVIAPLIPPVKVKYLAAFLYRGYLILAKVKKGKTYEAKHFLPLEVFEMIDITEGFLPHSIRLSLREHSFDLAASCEAEKEVWAAALVQARDESVIPPFELPASVSTFAAKSRRMSINALPVVTDTDDYHSLPSKRHTLAGPPETEDFAPTSRPASSFEDADDEAMPKSYTDTPAASPSRASFSIHSTPDRRTNSAILLRRASGNQRSVVDRALGDVFSESCATVRSRAQLNHALFLPDTGMPVEVSRRLSMRDSTMLSRRRSFLDAGSRASGSLDITFTGEIRGSVIPIRQTRSVNGRQRASAPHRRARSGSVGGESGTEVEGRVGESADETVTVGGSDFGTMTGGPRVVTRNSSMASIAQPYVSNSYTHSPIAIHRRSFNSLRRAAKDQAGQPPDRTIEPRNLVRAFTFNRHRTSHSIPTLGSQAESPRPFRRSSTYRAKSMPVSPVLSPTHSSDDLPQPSLRGRNQRHSTSSTPYEPTPTMSEYFLPPVDNEVTVYPLGLGYTNQSRIDLAERGRSSGSGAWSTLRRSMSFVKSNSSSGNLTSGAGSFGFGNSPRGSMVGLDEFGVNSFGSMGSGSGEGGRNSLVLSGASSEGLVMMNPTKAAQGESKEEEEGGDAPKRRMSVRLFKGLSRMTPM